MIVFDTLLETFFLKIRIKFACIFRVDCTTVFKTQNGFIYKYESTFLK